METDVQKVNGIEIVPYKEGLLPIIRLTDFFQLPRPEKKRLCLLVIVSDRGSIGLLTEDVIGQREVVVRPLRDPLIQVPGISGATANQAKKHTKKASQLKWNARICGVDSVKS